MVQTTEDRLEKAIQKQTDKIQYFCSAENISPNLAIHEFRKAFKRIRALLLFFPETTSVFFSTTRQQIKEKGKEISGLRESFVNAQLFDKEAVGVGFIADRKIKSVKELLFNKNKVETDTFFSERNFCTALCAFFDEVLSAIKKQEIAGVDNKNIRSTIEQSYQISFDLYNENANEFNPETLHSLRKKLKQLLYQFDFVKFYQPKFFKTKTDNLNKITEQLGYDHDLYILCTELKNETYTFTSDEIQTIENQINHLREINQVKMFLRLKQFFSDSPAVFNQSLENIF